MKKKGIITLCVGVSLLGGGCATNNTQAPHATSYPSSDQQIMQAGHHWDVLASHEAANIITSVGDKTPIYLNKTNSETSPFSTAFHELLTSQLVQSGATVVAKPYQQSVTVSYKTQVLEHNDRGYLSPKPGFYTALASGLWLAGQAIEDWSHPEALIAPIVIGADLFSGSWASRSPTELLITTQVQNKNLIVMSSSSIYYLNSSDESNYTESRLKSIKVVNK